MVPVRAAGRNRWKPHQVMDRFPVDDIITELERTRVSLVEMIPFSSASVAHARATPADMTSSPSLSTVSRSESTEKALVTWSIAPAAKIGSWS